MGKPKTLHQFLTGATQGDAITDHAFVIRRWLREMGFDSDIYALHIHPGVKNEVRPMAAYHPGKREPWVIYHHSVGSEVVEYLQSQALRLILIHHNVTPPQFFARIDPAWVERARQGERQLTILRTQTDLALADSEFNALDLQAAGYRETAVLPITLPQEQYNLPLNQQLAAEMQQNGPNLLFVSRLAANKRQEDLVKLLYYYHHIQPNARLILVGDRWTIQYDKWVESLAADLGLADHVILTGKVSQQEMVTYYQTADLYVSMSEHEGFGKPLIESMYLGLPILAFASTAVPYTMGQTGVMFYQKDYEQLAELVDILITDLPLRQRIITRQKQRVQAFLEPQVRMLFQSYLAQLFHD
ncbi:MAG: glycosyltransferase family 4 protein [Ardenticatenaceae bacterium]|nr:glycosyltransferase family 4 protein [Ardenticatenaceae bacterium]